MKRWLMAIGMAAMLLAFGAAAADPMLTDGKTQADTLVSELAHVNGVRFITPV